MISTLFISQYIDFRLSFAETVELYLIDQIQENQFEILIKDNGDSLVDDELESAKSKISQLNLNAPDRYFQYYHKGKNTLQIEIQLESNKLSLLNLNQILGLLMLQYPQKELIFTYLSPKGEYILNSQDFLPNFTEDEKTSKDFALFLHELLQNHLDEVVFSNVME